MSDPRRRIGTEGERRAAAHLERRGHRIIARNVRTRSGELDLISVDGRALVFTEVKTARGGRAGAHLDPVLSVGHRKQLRIRRLAREWLASGAAPRGYAEIRFDVVAITLDRGDGAVGLEHIVAAF